MPLRHLIALIIDTHASAEVCPSARSLARTKMASMQSFRKDQLASQIRSEDVGVAWPRIAARTKNYTTSVFGFPCGTPDGCSDDLPLHDVKDFAAGFRRTGTEYFIKRTVSLLCSSAFAVSS
jgi:hypothetical protein